MSTSSAVLEKKVPVWNKTAFVHIPTVGDHYSYSTGSAVMTRIFELAKAHEREGEQSIVVVNKGTRCDYPAGICVPTELRGYPGRNEKLVDVALGTLGFPRPFFAHAYEPMLAAIPRDFRGTVFLHNEAGTAIPCRKKLPNARIVIFAQDELFRTYTNAELRRVLDAADYLVCISKFLSECVTRRVPSHAHKVLTVLNGVDTERFIPCEEKKPTVPTIAFVGRVQPFKGPHVLLEAGRELYKRTKNFKIKIVGRGNFDANAPLTEYEQQLREIAAPMAECVEFQGFVDRHNIVDAYQRVSIFCAPSTWDEPCTLTVPEAMACGVATVAAAAGGIPEVGSDAVTYFKPSDSVELANILEKLIGDEATLKQMSARARARAEAISWQNQYRELRKAMGDR
jgi:glycosyltransferase involved in cell wall biosynthesis